jgi:hypothetical protein
MLDSERHAGNRAAGRPEAGGSLSAATRAWMAGWLGRARAAGALVIPVLHHSLLDHFSVIRDGFTLDDPAPVAAAFREAGARVALTGHIHVQDIARDTTADAALCDIATTALSVYPHQYGLARIAADRSRLDYSTRRLDVAAWARDTGSRDPRLLAWGDWSREWFEAASRSLATFGAGELAGISQADFQRMVDTFCHLNVAFFSGLAGESAPAIRAEPGYALWERAPPGLLRRYVMAILEEATGEKNRLSLVLR